MPSCCHCPGWSLLHVEAGRIPVALGQLLFVPTTIHVVEPWLVLIFAAGHFARHYWTSGTFGHPIQISRGIVTCQYICSCRDHKTKQQLDENKEYRHHSTRKRPAQLSCLAVRDSVSVLVRNIMDKALTPKCLRFSMLSRTFLLLPVPAQQPYVTYTLSIRSMYCTILPVLSQPT